MTDSLSGDRNQPQERDPWHWLRHRWGKWRAYSRDVSVRASSVGGIMFANTEFTSTPPWDFTEYREARSCLTCGATQDREIGR